MPNATEAQIKNRIQEFVAELDQLVRRSALEAVRGVLENGSAAPARRGPGRPAGATRRGPGRPRGASSAQAQEIAQAIQAHVAANDGQSVSQIASAVGAPLPVAKRAVAQLLASGGITKTGERRGTRYHAGSGGGTGGAVSTAGRRQGGRRKKAGRKA